MWWIRSLRDSNLDRITQGLAGQNLDESKSFGTLVPLPFAYEPACTFDNDAEQWVSFRHHSSYVGQDFFFPESGKVDYKLFLFNADEGNERTELKRAILHFLCGVAQLHQEGQDKNFTMLVHTSGRTDEHDEVVEVIEKTISILSDPTHRQFEADVAKLLKIAEEYSVKAPASICRIHSKAHQ